MILSLESKYAKLSALILSLYSLVRYFINKGYPSDSFEIRLFLILFVHRDEDQALAECLHALAAKIPPCGKFSFLPFALSLDSLS